MEVTFANDDLCQLDSDRSFRMGLSADVVRAYRKRMQQIRSAVDERDLRALKSLHFEKLDGKRRGQYSVRLNDQFRLVFKLNGVGSEKQVLIVGVVDYH